MSADSFQLGQCHVGCRQLHACLCLTSASNPSAFADVVGKQEHIWSAAAITNVAVLDQTVGAISGHNDVIQNQNANTIQKLL